jgi:hypothetical protein
VRRSVRVNGDPTLGRLSRGRDKAGGGWCRPPAAIRRYGTRHASPCDVGMWHPLLTDRHGPRNPGSRSRPLLPPMQSFVGYHAVFSNPPMRTPPTLFVTPCLRFLVPYTRCSTFIPSRQSTLQDAIYVGSVCCFAPLTTSSRSVDYILGPALLATQFLKNTHIRYRGLYFTHQPPTSPSKPGPHMDSSQGVSPSGENGRVG